MGALPARLRVAFGRGGSCAGRHLVGPRERLERRQQLDSGDAAFRYCHFYQ